MKTFECIAKSGNTGKEIVIFIRAVDASQAKMNALVLFDVLDMQVLT
jgi:hypothetical protein